MIITVLAVAAFVGVWVLAIPVLALIVHTDRLHKLMDDHDEQHRAARAIPAQRVEEDPITTAQQFADGAPWIP